MSEVTNCQTCHTLTNRVCSECNVCVFCTPECQQRANEDCRAHLACAMHKSRVLVRENLNDTALHLRMLPTLPTEVPDDAPPAHQCEYLFQGARHYLHVMLACTPATLFAKTVFGMSIAMGADKRLSAGFQRMGFPVGEWTDAITMVLGNMGELAHAQLKDARMKRAILVSGLVKNDRLHFDAIFVKRKNKAWTIIGIKPLWSQMLVTTPTQMMYKMHYRPKGDIPKETQHPLALVERALRPAQTAPLETEPPARDVPVPVRDPSQPDPTTTSPHPPQAPPPTPDPDPGSPDLVWERHRALAKGQARKQKTAPPWTAQLREALQDLE